MDESTTTPEWSIQQVAQFAGVTARTLRHYDEIGLLPPARVGANSYTLIHTVSETISHEEEGTPMPAEEMFAGFRFDPTTIDELEARAAQRSSGAEQHYYDELRTRTADWSEAQFQQVQQESAAIERRLLSLLRDGVAADDDAVFDVLDDDVASQRKLIQLDAAEYANLGHAFATPTSCVRIWTRRIRAWPTTCAMPSWRTRPSG